MIEFMRDCLKEGKDAITADKLDQATKDLKSKDITTITSGVLTELKPGGQYDLTKGVGYNSGTTAKTGFTVAKVGRYDSANTAASTTTTGTTTAGALANTAATLLTGAASAVASAVGKAITPGGTTTPAANLTSTSSGQTTTLNNGTPINSVVAVGGKTENDNSTTITNINQMSITADPWRQTAFNTGYQLYA